jgi:hypothetical protein
MKVTHVKVKFLYRSLLNLKDPVPQMVATPGVKARIGALVPGRRSAPPTFAKHQNLSATQVLVASPPVVTSWAIIARMVTLWVMTPLANRVQSEALG